jgi:hypothetical protein
MAASAFLGTAGSNLTVAEGVIRCPLSAIAFSRFAIIFRIVRCAARFPAHASW